MKTFLGVGLAFVMATAVSPAPALATSGGLNAEGCHTDRKGGTGYHCHRGSKAETAKSATPRATARQTSLSSAHRGAYANCTEARAAGASNIRRGEPGYGPHLDRDDDGIGCES